MGKSSFVVTNILIKEMLHLPSDVDILEVKYENDRTSRIFIKGDNVPDRETCRPYIEKTQMMGDYLYKWVWSGGDKVYEG